MKYLKSGNHEIVKTYETWLTSWLSCNLFNNELSDAFAYLALYIALPIIVTSVSLYTKTNKGVDSAYFYITTVISASNCLYDAANRRERGKKSVKNAKVLIICIFVTIVIFYSVVELFIALLSKTVHHYPDWILCFYFGAVMVALFDFGVLVLPKITFRNTKIEAIKKR